MTDLKGWSEQMTENAPDFGCPRLLSSSLAVADFSKAPPQNQKLENGCSLIFEIGGVFYSTQRLENIKF
ncbi:MAG: hypothetical protein D6714_07785 [Bacteroidetes bacterium]|nr:MAG: hypothetical protein D6714_07785 [Bacteroidota bacterium]